MLRLLGVIVAATGSGKGSCCDFARRARGERQWQGQFLRIRPAPEAMLRVSKWLAVEAPVVVVGDPALLEGPLREAGYEVELAAEIAKSSAAPAALNEK